MAKPSDHDLRALLEPYRAGDLEQSLRSARRFTRKWPKHPAGWDVLGDTLYKQGALDAAVEALRTALGYGPDTSARRDALGLALLARGEPDAAEREFSAALAGQPDDPSLLTHLALAIGRQYRLTEAEKILQRALVVQPASAEALEALGYNLRQQGRLREAARIFQRAVSRFPQSARAHQDLGLTLRDLEDHAGATRALEKATARAPDQATVHCHLARVYHEQGLFDAAATAFEQAIALDPTNIQAHAGLLRSSVVNRDDPTLDRVRRLLERPDLDRVQRARLHHALAHALTRAGAPESEIWAHTEAGAESRRQVLPYDGRAQERTFAAIQSTFDSNWLARHESEPKSAQPRPLFIVGMPRSGTTLVDRTLSQHPRVASAGERRIIQALVDEHDQETRLGFPAGFDTVNETTLEAIAQRYRREMLESRGDADWVIDKEPENFRYLAIIAAALPEAVILNIEREPADTCLSCYMQDFTAPLSYANGLADLGHYYRLYNALMDHWRSVLPARRLLEVSYEAWVQDLPKEATRVLEALGLSWDPACADFHRSSHPVRTASMDQVRQPVYSASIGRWRAYSAYLEPLFTALGPLAPVGKDTHAS